MRLPEHRCKRAAGHGGIPPRGDNLHTVVVAVAAVVVHLVSFPFEMQVLVLVLVVLGLGLGLVLVLLLVLVLVVGLVSSSLTKVLVLVLVLVVIVWDGSGRGRAGRERAVMPPGFDEMTQRIPLVHLGRVTAFKRHQHSTGRHKERNGPERRNNERHFGRPGVQERGARKGSRGGRSGRRWSGAGGGFRLEGL